MDKFEIFITILASLTPIVSVIVAIIVARRNNNKDIKKDAQELGIMQSDLGYIKSGIDDLKQSQKRHDEKLDILSERVTKVEAELQAHLENKSLHSHPKTSVNKK